MSKELGTLVDKELLVGSFHAPEGTIDMIYGRIRQGKTTHGVRVILDALQAGIPVYSNLNLDLSAISFDDRDKIRYTFWNFLLNRKLYYKFDKSNFHWVNEKLYPTIDELISFLITLTDCVVVWDEGQRLLNSYDGTRVDRRLQDWVLTTGHFNRRLVIISQRPTAVHVSARGNINRFFKCKKLLSWPVMLLRVTEYQDMLNESVDEETPASRQLFVMNKKVFNTFNTHYLRGGVPRSQEVYVQGYFLTFRERFIVFMRTVAYLLRLRRKR